MSVVEAVVVLIWFLGGALLWTLLEWLIHNFLGHHGKGRNFFAKEHVRHHATTHYFASKWKKILIATPVLAAVWGLSMLFLGPMNAGAFTLGLALMYAAYEIIHARAHTHPPRGRYSRWLRRHHYYHHFHKPSMNHGVTSGIWDVVFGTYAPVQNPIRIPEKHVLPWLVDPATGEVAAAYAADYVIIRKRGRKNPVVNEPPPAIKQVKSGQVLLVQ